MTFLGSASLNTSAFTWEDKKYGFMFLDENPISSFIVSSKFYGFANQSIDHSKENVVRKSARWKPEKRFSRLNLEERKAFWTTSAYKNSAKTEVVSAQFKYHLIITANRSVI